MLGLRDVSRHIFFVCCVLVVTACSATRVHLFTQGLEATAIEEVESTLQAAGFEVYLNDLPTPEGVYGPTVLYSPEHNNELEIEQLAQLMIDMGYDLMLDPFPAGNHFYTSSNVGLYLKPYDASLDRGDSLIGRQFNGDCDDVDAYLTLQTQRRFQVEFFDWDEASNEEVTTEITGHWKRDDDTVVLTIGMEQIQLLVIPTKSTTQHGVFEGLRLKNSTGKLRACDFVYREVSF